MRTNTSLICVHVARLRLDRGHELSSVHIQIRVCKHAIVYKTGKTRDYKTWSRSIAVLVIKQESKKAAERGHASKTTGISKYIYG